jgi:hypothetical protein
MLVQSHTELPAAGDDSHHPMVCGARLEEQRVVIAKVAGSNPVAHPNFSDVSFS